MDTASYALARAGVIVDLAAGRGTGGDAMGDRYISIEHFMGSANDDLFIASEDPDSIDGGEHDADNMVGDEPDYDGSDGDTISYEKSEEAVFVDMAPGTAPNLVEATDINEEGSYARDDAFGTDITGIENVIGSSHDDKLIR